MRRRADPMPLKRVLRAVARIAPRNHLVIVLSDFDVVDDGDRAPGRRHLAAATTWCSASSPTRSAKTCPRACGSSSRTASCRPRSTPATAPPHSSLREMASGRLAAILDWQRRFGVPVLPLSAAEETLPQMRRLMGLGAR